MKLRVVGSQGYPRGFFRAALPPAAAARVRRDIEHSLMRRANENLAQQLVDLFRDETGAKSLAPRITIESGGASRVVNPRLRLA